MGPLLLCAKSDYERRIFLNAIGPVWNGNEVWLVTGSCALFAAFPQVYATVFSGFYDAFMLLLVALIFRAVAIEFRSQRSGTSWRTTWDVAFDWDSFAACSDVEKAGKIDRWSPVEIKTILVPTDLQAESIIAIRYALTLAKQFDANLTLLHVLEDPTLQTQSCSRGRKNYLF
jgi:cytochrome d ubiquinol oxidase subunit II